jgi:hypothetical protein
MFPKARTRARATRDLTIFDWPRKELIDARTKAAMEKAQKLVELAGWYFLSWWILGS